MATAEDARVDPFSRRLAEASSIADFRSLISDLGAIEAAGDTAEKILDLRGAAFGRLRRLTFGRAGEAVGPILEDLLPLCLRPDDRQSEARWRSHPGELLRSWLDDFNGADRHRLREAALAPIVDALSSGDPIAAVVTLSFLGFRDDRLTSALWDVVVRRDDEVGDRAIRTLINLGVPEPGRNAILNEIYRRIERRWAPPLVACMIELPDLESLDPVFDWLGTRPVRTGEGETWTFLDDYTLQVISRVADRHLGEDEIQDAIWHRVVELQSRNSGLIERAFRMNSSLARSIDTPEVIAMHLGMLEQSDAKPVDLLYYRLEEFFSPRQLIGWNFPLDVLTLDTLLGNASIPSAMQGPWKSERLNLKLAAWECLLCLGRSEVARLIGIAMEIETNGYALGELFDIAACTELPTLPPGLQGLIAGSSDRLVVEGNERLIAQIGAIRVAQAARSRESFDMLLGYRPIQSGGVLLGLIDALADCASALISRGEMHAKRVLWDGLRRGKSDILRTMSAATLAELLRDGDLPTREVVPLIDAMEDQSLDLYARNNLIEAAGHLRTRPPDPRVVSSLLRVARAADDGQTHKAEKAWPNPQQVAVGALARLGVLADDPSMLEEMLGLSRVGGRWDFAAGATTNPHSLGLLYASSPEAFAPAVARFLDGGDWGAVAALRPHLENAAAHPIVVEAVARRIARSNTGRTAEPELLPLLARLDPDRLAAKPLGNMNDWTPQLRAAFADAIRVAEISDSEAWRLLVAMMGDGQYGVRRAAYRAASVRSSRLASHCQFGATWMEGPGAVEVRERAAEAAAWLRPDDTTKEIKALAVDPEPTVRDAFARCKLERRDREWSALYVDHVTRVKTASEIPEAWKYGRALGRIGDDLALERLDSRRADPDIPPAVRYWLSRIAKEVRKRWDEVTSDWPKPWYHHRGRLEEVTGVVEGDAGEVPFRGWLYQEAPAEQLGLVKWGGWTTDPVGLTNLSVLKVEGRTPAEIMVNRSSFSSDPARTFVSFLGQGRYPSDTSSDHHYP